MIFYFNFFCRCHFNGVIPGLIFVAMSYFGHFFPSNFHEKLRRMRGQFEVRLKIEIKNHLSLAFAEGLNK